MIKNRAWPHRSTLSFFQVQRKTTKSLRNEWCSSIWAKFRLEGAFMGWQQSMFPNLLGSVFLEPVSLGEAHVCSSAFPVPFLRFGCERKQVYFFLWRPGTSFFSSSEALRETPVLEFLWWPHFSRKYQCGNLAVGCLSGEECPWLESASCILGGGEAGGFVGCVSKNGVALHILVRERECGPDPGTS